tara:strand:+ start:76 stop:1380 length:1305 start_codon:yes stop_codon:yes gene_type:complete
MSINFDIFFKFFLTIIIIILSFYFFATGYNSLKDINNLKTNKKNINFENLSENKKSLKDINVSVSEQNILIKDSFDEEFLVIVKKNDTFGKIISEYEPNNKLKNQIIALINKQYNLKNLRINQKIYFYKDEKILKKIIIPINISTDLVVKISTDEILVEKNKIDLEKEINSKKFIVKSSIYEDGQNSDIPNNILSEAVRILSFDVDFQRDIKKNNTFEISYETFFNVNRNTLSYGNVMYLNLGFGKKNLEYFFFKTQDGYLNYFNKEGKNAQKALMQTPIDGARLSSSFGMRKHPILGYNKLHKGLDFAAPSGTPIYAAGNGVIEYIGRKGTYGKYIRIRHNGSYKTAYAHMKNFKKGLSKGSRVNQGEIIGYVGSTGRSTGPHLHYEVIYQGKQINPKKMNLPSGKILEGKELENFKKEMKKIYSDYLFSLYE